MLTSPALFGAVRVKGDRLIEGVYPAVMGRDEFTYLQAKRSAKAKRKPSTRKGKTATNLFGGMVFCGYCGSAMVVGGYTNRKTKQTRRQYACHGARTGKTECRMHGWTVGELEDSVLFCLTQLNFNELFGAQGANLTDSARLQLAALKYQLDDANKKITNVEQAIVEGAAYLAQTHNELSTQREELKLSINEQERYVVIVNGQEGSGASRHKGLIKLFKTLKHSTDDIELRTVREQVVSSVAQAVSSITLYPMGHNARESLAERFADIRFTNGAERRIEAGEC